MGRRSINTTKSGKYMNPTDQARKEARKKELKKNKRQRQMVRAAVLKNKDPSQILEEMEKIDEMEYNVLQPSPLNEKVLRDKRKKLKETFDRVMRLYHNDEPEHWADLKRKEVEYEKKRLKKQQYYESVKHAQSVQIDDIPLPSSTQAPSTGGSIIFPTPKGLPPPPASLSLPPFAPGAPPGVLKRSNDLPARPTEKPPESRKKDVPGVPQGPPPNLLEMPDLDTDAEDDEVVLKEYNPKIKSNKGKSVAKPNSLQQRMLAISGQNIDEFMKEMENVHKKKEREREAAGRKENAPESGIIVGKDGEDDADSSNGDGSDDSDAADDRSDSSDSDDDDDEEESEGGAGSDTRKEAKPTPVSVPVVLPVPPIPLPAVPTAPLHHHSIPAPPMPPVTGLGPPPMIFRPPPLRPPAAAMPRYGLPMPPGPPPGPRPVGIGGMAPRLGMRMPPGPPPNMPPRMQHHHKNPHQQQQQQQQQQLQMHPKDAGKGVTTITAKPQIRNLSADVTRFVPSTLRVKREETRKPNRMKPYAQEPSNTSGEANKAATKDDAYLQFMNEMQGLL